MNPGQHSEKSRAEPLDPLPGAVRGAEPWYPETKNFTEMGKDLRMKLADIVALQSQKGGVHSLQETWGCETQEDNTSRGFRRFYYDGQPFLFYDEKTHRWTAPQPSANPLALEIKKSWDTDSFQNMDSWAHVQGELCGKVHKYLESWMTFMRRTALSTVRINCSQASEGMVTLTCWASSFCPWNISLAWIRDDEPLSQDSQSPVCALTDENGTCQAWGVSIRVPRGKEQSFTCSLEHSWNRTLYPMTCGMVPVDQSFWPKLLLGISAVVAVVAVAALRALWFRRRTEPIGL